MTVVLHWLRGLSWRLLRPRTLGVKCLVTRERRVLLVRTRYSRHWALPGGGVERGESFAEAARRELHEETQIELGDARLWHIYLSRREGKEDHVALFVAESASGEPRPDRREVVQAAFFELANLPEDTSPATRRRIAEYVAGEPIRDAW